MPAGVLFQQQGDSLTTVTEIPNPEDTPQNSFPSAAYALFLFIVILFRIYWGRIAKRCPGSVSCESKWGKRSTRLYLRSTPTDINSFDLNLSHVTVNGYGYNFFDQ